MIKWQTINLVDIIAANLILSIIECFRKMCIEMNTIQRNIDVAYQGFVHFRKNIIRVCRSNAIFAIDFINSSIKVSNMINSLYDSIINYEAVHKSIITENYVQIYNDEENEVYFTNCQYRQNRSIRDQYKNKFYTFRTSSNSSFCSSFRSSQRIKKCFVYDKNDCWSIKHIQQKRNDSKKKFNDWHPDFKTRSNYEQNLQRYIIDYEDVKNDENITHYFDDLIIDAHDNDDALNSSIGSYFIKFELFHISIDPLQDSEPVTAINLLADNVFKHRIILKDEISLSIVLILYIFNIIIDTRYDDTEFKELFIGSRTTAQFIDDIDQLQTLQRFDDSIQLNKSTVDSTNFIFEINSTEFIETSLLIIFMKSIIFHIIFINISFFLCLADMNKLKTYFNNIINEIIQSNQSIRCFCFKIRRFHSIIRKYGHAFLLWRISAYF